MTETAIECERRIRARPETIFAYFTDSDRYTRWMGVEATLNAQPGGIYRVVTPQGYVALGEFVEVEPPKRVVFTWGWEGNPEVPPGSTTVEVTLQQEADHTIVRLVHSGLPAAAITPHVEGWERYLDRLVVASGGGDPGPDDA